MKSILYDDAKIEDLLPIVRKLDASLVSDGYIRREAGKTTAANNITVSRAEYQRGDENVFVIANKPIRATQ